MERFFRTVKDKLGRFKSVDALMQWYKMTRPHMSLNLGVIETPYQAYVRKMPGEEEGVIEDEESGEVYHARKEQRKGRGANSFRETTTSFRCG